MTASVDAERSRATLVLDESAPDPAALTGQATEPAAPTPPPIAPSDTDANFKSNEPETSPGAASQLEPAQAQPEVAEAQPEPLAVTIATAVQAAAFKLMPFRVGCALCVAVVAVSEDWDAPIPIPHLVRVILANLALILSSAWMLANEPRTCKNILAQVHVRGGSSSMEWYYDLAGKLTRMPGWALKVLVTLAWAAYTDSGTYIAAAVIIYVLRARPGDVVAESSVEETVKEVLHATVGSHSEL